MIFTSIPQNGSSWHETLRFGFDTEQSAPTDLTLEIATETQSIAQRKLYGVTCAEVDIAPYLREFSYLPPIIGDSVTITPSRSAQRVRLLVDGVTSRHVSLFHAPYNPSAPHIISRAVSKRTIAANEPIIITLLATWNMVLSVTFKTLQGTSNMKFNAKPTGTPMDIVIPSSIYPEHTESINITINNDKQRIAELEYSVVDYGDKGWCIAWFNMDGGVETYTFPTGIRRSYDAKIASDDNLPLEHYSMLRNATVNYRLCSAYEIPEHMERLAEIVFSPRVFAIKDGVFIPIKLRERHVEFDNHGGLRQMCIDIEQQWKGGRR